VIPRPGTTSCGRTARRIALVRAGRASLALAIACAAPAACARPKLASPPIVTFPGGIVWQRALESPPAQAPAFDDARAYVALRGGAVTAVDHASGETAWSAPASATVTPVRAGGLLIAAEDGTAWALDAETGRARWRHDLPAKAALPPAPIARGVLFVTESGEALLLAAEDGRQIWTLPVGGTPTCVAASPGAGAWIGLQDGRVLAIDPSRGAVSWTRRLKAAPLVITPLKETVLVGAADHFLYSLKATSGRVTWRWRTGGAVSGTAVADARRVYFASRDATLRALDRRHGDMRWQRPLSTRAVGGPLLAGEVILVAGVAPEIRGFRTSDGGEIGVVAIPGRALLGPVLAPALGTAPARVLVLTAGGQMLAIGQTVEPPIVPFELPAGRKLPPEALPVAR
jgi:outer membrane protein assembly factor BamB